MKNKGIIQIQNMMQGIRIGIIVGFVVSLFRILLVYAEHILAILITLVHEETYGILIWIMILILGYMIMRWMIHHEPSLARGGIPLMEKEMIQPQSKSSWRLLIMKPCACVVSVLCGLSVGRGGPAYQTGGLTGDAIFRRETHLSRSVTLACGAGAGIAAAFGAPLAAFCFMWERQRVIHNELSFPALCGAIASASMISFCFFGITPLMIIGSNSYLPISGLGISLLVILSSMMIGNGYRYLLSHGVGWLHRYCPFSLVTTIGFAFLLSFLMMCFFPQVLGSGLSMVSMLQSTTPLIWSLLILILVKMLYSLLCFTFGAPGGIFFPTLILGGCIGLFIGSILYEMKLVPLPMLSTCILLGMAGFFTAVVQTPLTASFLCVELTSGWIFLPMLLFVTLSISSLSKLGHIQSVYDNLKQNKT